MKSKNATLPVETEWRRDAFASVYRDGHFAHLIDLPDHRSGVEFGARLFADATTEYFRIFEVMRDYGMYERTEAPQYYPPVERFSDHSVAERCSYVVTVDGIDLKQPIKGDAGLLLECKRMLSGFHSHAAAACLALTGMNLGTL